MQQTIGFLELNSIAKGVQAADAQLVFAKAVCPGKYIVLFTGEVAAVTSALEAGEAIAGVTAVDSVVIPSVDRQVIKAINLSTVPEQTGAVGVMEFFSVTEAIYAADSAVKAADVTLIDVRLATGIGGKSFVVLTGDVSAVESSVKAGTQAASDKGLVVSSVVIPNPRPEIFESLY